MSKIVDEWTDDDFPPRHHATEQLKAHRGNYLFFCSCGMTWIRRRHGEDLPKDGTYKSIAVGRRVFTRLFGGNVHA